MHYTFLLFSFLDGALAIDIISKQERRKKNAKLQFWTLYVFCCLNFSPIFLIFNFGIQFSKSRSLIITCVNFVSQLSKSSKIRSSTFKINWILSFEVDMTKDKIK